MKTNIFSQEMISFSFMMQKKEMIILTDCAFNRKKYPEVCYVIHQKLIDLDAVYYTYNCGPVPFESGHPRSRLNMP